MEHPHLSKSLETRMRMHPVYKEHFQHDEALMSTIDIKNGHSSVKFHNWAKKSDLPFSTDSNSCIVVPFTPVKI